MKSTIKHTIVAFIAAPLFFVSCSKEESKPATTAKAVMGENSTAYTCDTRCWQEETAWSYGCKYTDKGGWATYTKYESNKCVAIYAGQNMYAGTAHFSCASNGKVTITINLADGWELAPGNESVKIQGYSSAPNSKPAPGQFTYKGSCLTVEVCASCYYGIHLDLRKEVACD